MWDSDLRWKLDADVVRTEIDNEGSVSENCSQVRASHV
jgi:hypothetical protein